MFKYLYLLGTFPLPLPNTTILSTPIHMISLITGGSLGSFDPWVVPRPLEIKLYGENMSFSAFKTSY